MAGHSKWANIKHRKGCADEKRGKIFSKIAKEILVAARAGGGDPSANITLRAVIQKARSYNMPADNIERAIKKGTGEVEAVALEELNYEGYGPGGVGVIVEVLTDNRNRTAAEVRHIFTKHNASLGGQGSVSRSFQRKGLISVKSDAADEEKIMEVALEAGAEDLKEEDAQYEIVTDPGSFMTVVDALSDAGIAVEQSEISLIPDTYMSVTDPKQVSSLLQFIEALEDLDDVQNVFVNFDIDDALIESITANG